MPKGVKNNPEMFQVVKMNLKCANPPLRLVRTTFFRALSNVRFGSVFKLQSASSRNIRKLEDFIAMDQVEKGYFESGSIDVNKTLEANDPDYQASHLSEVFFQFGGSVQQTDAYLATGPDAQTIQSIKGTRGEKYSKGGKQVVDQARSAGKLRNLLITSEVTDPHQIAPIKVTALDFTV